MTQTSFRTCPLCEATCGLSLTIDAGQVIKVRGDEEDVFSHGFICPKGVSIGELHHDPSRLRYPLVRGADGVHRRATWDEAWAEIARLLAPVRSEHGNDAIGVYLGNPNVHNVSSSLYGPAVIRALETRNVFSASTVDQMPQQIAVVNLLTGNLDREGGVMWPLPASGGPTTSGTPGIGRGIRIPGSQRTRVRGLPSVLGEFPAAAMAEEIDTPSEDGRRLRGLITVAGNPVVSTPDGARLDAALATLDVMISIDAYVTETSRHAHVILPAPSPLARGHYDLAFSSLAVRNIAHWSPPSVPLRHDADADEMDEGDILLRLACVILGDALSVDAMDDLVAAELAGRACKAEASRVHGRDPQELVAALAPRRRQERLLDLMIRSGPYGDGFGTHPDGLTLADLEAAPHGIDLGPLKPRLPEVLRTPSGRIEAAPPQLLAEAVRMADVLAVAARSGARDELVLVGRRGLRSNNSWMHNVPLLAKGSNRCTLWVHPLDAAALGVVDGGNATVTNDVGTVTTTVEVTDVVSRGVVCLPHGWGHSDPGTWGPVAAANPGVNSNILTPSSGLDELSGTAVLNGIPVTVSAA